MVPVVASKWESKNDKYSYPTTYGRHTGVPPLIGVNDKFTCTSQWRDSRPPSLFSPWRKLHRRIPENRSRPMRSNHRICLHRPRMTPLNRGEGEVLKTPTPPPRNSFSSYSATSTIWRTPVSKMRDFDVDKLWAKQPSHLRGQLLPRSRSSPAKEPVTKKKQVQYTLSLKPSLFLGNRYS